MRLSYKAPACQGKMAPPPVPTPAPQKLEAGAGAVLGVFQGMCCPTGLVGVSFLVSLPLAGIFCFLMTFTAFSSIGTGAIAMVWAHATRGGVVAGISQKTLYRVSCGFTLLLGAFWIVANYGGFIEKLDYTEFMSSSLTTQ
jgi:hypothetical protein